MCQAPFSASLFPQMEIGLQSGSPAGLANPIASQFPSGEKARQRTGPAIHPSGLFLASAPADKRVLLSKLPTGEPVSIFEPALPPNPLFPRVIEHIAFDESGVRLAAAYAEGDFRIWDTSALTR